MHYQKIFKNTFSLIAVFFLSFFIHSCSVNPVTGKKELSFMSEEQEIALGKQTDPSIVAMYGLFEDQKLQDFISKKGQEMAAISHRPNLPYEFKILDSPVVNAFAVPGGFVYFTRGILAHFNNEAEFAGVLGHEIGHITARHGVQQQTKATIAQILFVGGLIVSPAFREFADAAQQGMQLLFLKYSRDNESQSDELGVEYSTEIGYDANRMANFFNTLNNMRVGTEAEALPTFLSTHPDPLDRYNTVKKLAEKAQKADKRNSYVVNRESYLRMIDGIIYGEDPNQGYVESNTFYHPELKFQFPIPNDWNIINTPSQVQMAPKDGAALMLLSLTPGNSLDEAASTVVEQYNLTVVEKSRIKVNGLDTYAMISDQVNEQNQQKIRIMTYLISYNRLIYTFHGVSLYENFDGKVNVFQRTMNNFNRLTDASKINVKPERIAIKTANQTSSLQNQLQRFNINKDRYQEIALLNSMALDGRLEKGALFKIIVK